VFFIEINLNLLSALDYAINWAVVSLGLSVSVAFGQLRNCFSPIFFGCILGSETPKGAAENPSLDSHFTHH